ncbi:uncharacterized protein G2W53_040340 [Senna tora]|uniref:Uncharacterized protein n=1 Tax=Senna tora TaxID=362788 RepID=A0A834W1W1_9FABA|nr:uncharacterized protein G2W53_040340 [Senna tora]
MDQGRDLWPVGSKVRTLISPKVETDKVIQNMTPGSRPQRSEQQK